MQHAQPSSRTGVSLPPAMALLWYAMRPGCICFSAAFGNTLRVAASGSCLVRPPAPNQCRAMAGCAALHGTSGARLARRAGTWPDMAGKPGVTAANRRAAHEGGAMSCPHVRAGRFITSISARIRLHLPLVLCSVWLVDQMKDLLTMTPLCRSAQRRRQLARNSMSPPILGKPRG